MKKLNIVLLLMMIGMISFSVLGMNSKDNNKKRSFTGSFTDYMKNIHKNKKNTEKTSTNKNHNEIKEIINNNNNLNDINDEEKQQQPTKNFNYDNLLDLVTYEESTNENHNEIKEIINNNLNDITNEEKTELLEKTLTNLFSDEKTAEYLLQIGANPKTLIDIYDETLKKSSSNKYSLNNNFNTKYFLNNDFNSNFNTVTNKIKKLYPTYYPTLYFALKDDNADEITSLFNKGFRLNKYDVLKLLHSIIEDGDDLDEFKKIIGYAISGLDIPNLYCVSKKYETPLEYAKTKDRELISKYLENINTLNNNNNLKEAIKDKDLEKCNDLIENGATVLFCTVRSYFDWNEEGFTKFKFIIENKLINLNTEQITNLFNKALLNTMYGRTESKRAEYLIKNFKSFDFIPLIEEEINISPCQTKKLEKLKSLINDEDIIDEDLTIDNLCISIIDEDNKYAIQLIEQGVDVNIQNTEKRFPIYYAAKYWNSEIVKYLIENNLVNINNEFPYLNKDDLLITAVRNNDCEIVELILKNKFNTKKEYENKEPLHFAVESNNIEIVEILINYGFDVNCKDIEGRTPLFYAAWYNNNDMCPWGNRSDPTHVPSLYYLSLKKVDDTEQIDIIKLLCKNGADVNHRQNYTRRKYRLKTPLYYAAVQKENPETTRLLLNLGADPTISDNSGEWDAKTIFYYCFKKANYSFDNEIIKLFIKYNFWFSENDLKILLFELVKDENIIALQALIERCDNLDLKVCNNSKIPLLYYVVKKNNKELEKLLRSNGAKFNEEELNNLITHFSKKNNSNEELSTLKFLLKESQNQNFDIDYQSLFELAINNSCYLAAKIFLPYLNDDIKSNYYLHALLNGNDSLISFFNKNNVKLNETDYKAYLKIQQTEQLTELLNDNLFNALKEENFELCKQLIDLGAKIPHTGCLTNMIKEEKLDLIKFAIENKCIKLDTEQKTRLLEGTLFTKTIYNNNDNNYNEIAKYFIKIGADISPVIKRLEKNKLNKDLNDLLECYENIQNGNTIKYTNKPNNTLNNFYKNFITQFVKLKCNELLKYYIKYTNEPNNTLKKQPSNNNNFYENFITQFVKLNCANSLLENIKEDCQEGFKKVFTNNTVLDNGNISPRNSFIGNILSNYRNNSKINKNKQHKDIYKNKTLDLYTRIIQEIYLSEYILNNNKSNDTLYNSDNMLEFFEEQKEQMTKMIKTSPNFFPKRWIKPIDN